MAKNWSCKWIVRKEPSRFYSRNQSVSYTATQIPLWKSSTNPLDLKENLLSGVIFVGEFSIDLKIT